MSKTAVQKAIKEICRKPPQHWVGDGFHVYPVFANKAFTQELSPFLMFDYAAPKGTSSPCFVGQSAYDTVVFPYIYNHSGNYENI